jgi:hypothetical protein
MHPRLRMTWKRALKIERIARLSLDPAGFTNEQIANHLGCDKQTVVLIRQLPAYHAKMLELATGVLSHHDAELRMDIDNARQELRSMIPSSMMVIRDALLNKKNPQLQFKAALEVMDREGSMAKVSKSSVTVETKPNMQVDPNVAANLMSLLANAPRTDGASHIDATCGGDFTRSAPAAEAQQVDMSRDNTTKTLEELDLSTSKPN